MSVSAIVLAAGEGTRMRSDRPKPLHMICGRAMVMHVIESLRSLGQFTVTARGETLEAFPSKRRCLYFEWAAGYSQRWGLVRVDFNTLARSPKTSASWYSAVARSNSIPGD